jgi:hypothetical protein
VLMLICRDVSQPPSMTSQEVVLIWLLLHRMTSFCHISFSLCPLKKSQTPPHDLITSPNMVSQILLMIAPYT